MKDRILKMVESALNTCLPWVTEKDGAVQFVDPLDNEEISAHYGATHMSAALIIYGTLTDNNSLVKKGEDLLLSVLDRWNENKELEGFHNDFNNFALCVIERFTDKYHEKIKNAVMETRDTLFDTVNWLPMRWFVNKCRYEWTNDQAYLDVCRSCSEKINQATYSDGFIDDMIPIGRSFSLQYDVATVAFLQYLRHEGEEIDLSLQTGALLNAVCPDGDINYFGRGTNQLFSWGLWIYLLANDSQSELGRALDYLEAHLPAALANNNLMLNDYPGSEKYMWWDYHYCSVYTAHLLLWLVLAWRDYGKDPVEPKLVTDGSSGIQIYKNDNAFVVTFNGRGEYLSERGPLVEAVWTKQAGTIYKGAFGPWKGLFGNKYLQPDATIRNFWGLTSIGTEIYKNTSNPVLRRIRSNKIPDAEESVKPVFISPAVDLSGGVKITYRLDGQPLMLNLPVSGGMITVSIDGKEQNLADSICIKNQYGLVSIKQCLINSGEELMIKIPC